MGDDDREDGGSVHDLSERRNKGKLGELTKLIEHPSIPFKIGEVALMPCEMSDNTPGVVILIKEVGRPIVMRAEDIPSILIGVYEMLAKSTDVLKKSKERS